MEYPCVSCKKDTEIEAKHMCRPCLLENSMGRSLRINRENSRYDRIVEMRRILKKMEGCDGNNS